MRLLLVSAIILSSLLSFGQKKPDSLALLIKKMSKTWHNTDISYDASKHQYYNNIAEREIKTGTGVVLNGKKFITNGLGIIQSIPPNHIKKLEIYRDTADIRKYFSDTTVKVVLIIDTNK